MGKVKNPPKKQAAIESSPVFQSHPTHEELRALGKSLREKCPRDGHAVWKAPNNRETLQEDRRLLLDRYKFMDVAAKVVGVGSVGTFCAIILMMASDDDPLFLQVKQAGPSVLEPYAGKSLHPNHGQRVVHGCRMMQSASDIFLGWTEGDLGRHFYIRQLKDMKLKPMVEVLNQSAMLQYAEICGWTLAHAHARSGESVKISGYLGKSDIFDKAIADFSIAYADQSEQDHDTLMKAVRAGKLEVFVEEEQ